MISRKIITLDDSHDILSPPVSPRSGDAASGSDGDGDNGFNSNIDDMHGFKKRMLKQSRWILGEDEINFRKNRTSHLPQAQPQPQPQQQQQDTQDDEEDDLFED